MSTTRTTNIIPSASTSSSPSPSSSPVNYSSSSLSATSAILREWKQRSPSKRTKRGFEYELMKDDDEVEDETIIKDSPTRVSDFDENELSLNLPNGSKASSSPTMPHHHHHYRIDQNNDDDSDDPEEEDEEEEDDLPPQQLQFSKAEIFRNLAPPSLAANSASSSAGSRGRPSTKKTTATKTKTTPTPTTTTSAASCPILSAAEQPTPPPPVSFSAPVSTTTANRRSRQYFSSLPTLDEASSSDYDDYDEEEGNNTSNSSGNASPTSSSPRNSLKVPNSPRRNKIGKQKDQQLQQQGGQPLDSFLTDTSSKAGVKNGSSAGNSSGGSSSNSGASRKSSAGQRKTSRDRIAELEEQADDLGRCGEEEQALLTYKRALKITRHETARIKSQLRQVDDMHPSTVKSIHSRLHEDWLQVGWSIASIRSNMAILCERVGDYDRAMVCCKEALDIYKRQLAFCVRKNKNEYVDDIRKKSDDMQIMHDKMTIAKDSFEKRKAMHEEIMVLRRLLSTKRDPDERMKLFATIEDKIRTALRVESDILGKGHPQVADTTSLLATMAMEQGHSERALEHMAEALAITKRALGMKHPLTGEMLLQIARIYASLVPVDEAHALEYYEQAVSVFRAAQRNPRFVGSTLNEISVIRIRQREYDKAVEMLIEALDIFKTDATLQKDPTVATDCVQIWRNLGECYSCQKNYEKAVDAFVHALDLQREARKAHDATASVDNAQQPPVYLADDESIADTLRRLGKSYVGFTKHQDALNVYGEALLIHRAAVIKAANPEIGRPDRNLPERQDQLAHTLFCIAETREAMGDLDDALRIYSESMQLRLFSDAHRQDKRVNLVHCAMCLRGIGNIHLMKQEYEAAHKVFEDALSYCRGHGVPEHHPIVQMIKQRLEEAEWRCTVDCLEKDVMRDAKVAQSCMIQGKLDRAVEALTRVMAARKAILKALKVAKQDSTEAKRATAMTLKLFGKVLLQKGDIKNAERAYADALKLLKKVRSGNVASSGKDSSARKAKEESKAVAEIENILKRLHCDMATF